MASEVSLLQTLPPTKKKHQSCLKTLLGRTHAGSFTNWTSRNQGSGVPHSSEAGSVDGNVARPSASLQSASTHIKSPVSEISSSSECHHAFDHVYVKSRSRQILHRILPVTKPRRNHLLVTTFVILYLAVKPQFYAKKRPTTGLQDLDFQGPKRQEGRERKEASD